jgi:hypothetical protein
MIGNGLVFFVSLMMSLLFLVIERLAGIGLDFHPDAITYTELYYGVANNIIEKDFLSFPNNAYYLVSYVFNGSPELLISLNIFLYSLTNVIFYNFVSRTGVVGLSRIVGIIVFFTIPYRLHLSVHVLKDTMIIFFFIYIMCNGWTNYRSVLSIISMFCLRIFSFSYLGLIVHNRIFKFGVFLLFLIIVLFNDQFTTFLLKQNNLDMTFREFDNVPNFSDLGLLGSLIRAIVWPFFVISGFFVFLSPSIAFVPIAFGAWMIQGWSIVFFKKIAFSVRVYIIMMLIALLVPGFTSYIRYCFPLLIVLPILMLKSRKEFNK